MNMLSHALTPKEIVAELDRYIVGQNEAKRAVAVALRNRFRRQSLPAADRDDVLPKNILMIGPTGVGKTEIARRLAQLARAPFVKVEATKFTEVGYVGRDVEAMIRDLVSASVRLVEQEKLNEVEPEVKALVDERLLDIVERDHPAEELEEPTEELVPDTEEPEFGDVIDGISTPFGFVSRQSAEAYQRAQRIRDAHRLELKERLLQGEFDDDFVEIDVEEASNPFVQVFSNHGIEEMGFDMANANSPFGSRRAYRKMKLRDARDTMLAEETKRALERLGIHKEALARAEQMGIIFIDEIDKVAGKSGGSGPDVSREGVQRDLLPVIEGSTVQTKFGSVRTDHILFICAGAFHISKPSDLIPELQGRLPIRVTLSALSENDFQRILREPKNALTKQYEQLLEVDGVDLQFTEEAIDEIAKFAININNRVENIGARRLHTVMERLLEEELFEAPFDEKRAIKMDAKVVRDRLETLASDLERSRNVL